MIIAALLLASLGIVVLYSSSPTQAIQQLIYVIIGLFCYFLVSRFDFRAIKPLVTFLYIVAIIFLIVVLVLGLETRGSVRWISLGFFNFQPSEISKPILILTLAFFWSRHSASWINIGKSLLLLLPFFLLVFIQPDLGTSLTIAFIWLAILIASNISLIKILLIFLLGILVAPLSWLLMQDYQKQRIASFMFPGHDPLGVGFHVIQSMIAVGSGQFFGRGLGRGTQSRLQFLPEFRTDFIFAFIAEELGFMGSAIVLFLFIALFVFMIRYLTSASEKLGQLIIIGVMAMLFFQSLVNIGMNIGIMPITGITLPLLSYGGSSMIATFISLALIVSVHKFGSKKEKITKFELLDSLD